MRLVRVTLCSALLAAPLAVLLSAAPARATGYWNVPCNLNQWMGVGKGAGYHACYVLGPINWDNVCDHNEVRLPHAPSPPCYGCSYCDCSFGESTQYVPTEASQVVPKEAPMTPPTVEELPPTRAIFDAPVEP